MAIFITKIVSFWISLKMELENVKTFTNSLDQMSRHFIAGDSKSIDK